MKFACIQSELARLRRECQQLIVCVAEKFFSCRINSQPQCNFIQCDHRVSDNNQSEDEEMCDNLEESSDEESVLSRDSDETFAPSDNDIEIDDTHKLYGDDYLESRRDLSEDDSSVEEMYSDYTRHKCREAKSKSTDLNCSEYDECDTAQNLICPGDVIQYCNREGDKTISKDTVISINDMDVTQYILLQNGSVLHPLKHAVCKVASYCNETNQLLPIPQKQWYNLDKCLIQTGSIDDSENYCDDDDDDEDNNGEDDEAQNTIHSDTNPRNRQRYVNHIIWVEKLNFLIFFFYSSSLLLKKSYFLCFSRKRNSQGLTEYKQKSHIRSVRRKEKEMDRRPEIPPYPKFNWINAEENPQEYKSVIDDINHAYRQMLAIGKVAPVFRNTKGNVLTMLTAKTKLEFNGAKETINKRYQRHIEAGKTTLSNFSIETEFIPHPDKWKTSEDAWPTKREMIVKEQILTFEQLLENLNIFECTICRECHIEANPVSSDRVDYVCKTCTKRNDPDFFINNNLHPVWYNVDEDGNHVTDESGKKIPQYHIPEELSSLTMYEKLLIRRCANFVPTVHLRNGICAIKGHAVTFPQNIMELCDELPQRKETIVTFIRNLGNKNTTDAFPTSLRVNRTRVIEALKWLKKHNQFYHNININEKNLDWMKGKEEVNLCTEALTLDIKDTVRSRKEDTEEEYVSTANNTTPGEGEDYLPMQTVHANETVTVPSGYQAQPIRELIEVAKKTNQSDKVMNFPPIDHDSPIS